jgi:hypothetical protein
MAEGLTLDSGALIAAEKGEKRFWTYWEEALDRRAVVTVPVVVVAQVWRGNSPIIARILAACRVETPDLASARRAGELLATSRSSDVVDAFVVLGAAVRRDAILTSDPDDISRPVAAHGNRSRVLRI